MNTTQPPVPPHFKGINNYLVDVAFSVEGPWQSYEDIPIDALIAGLESRLRELRGSEEIDAFGFCDVYEVEEMVTEKTV
jgi:hypothetical protein